jgi:hypothetical protein
LYLKSSDLIYSLGTTQIDYFAYFFVDKYHTIAHRDSWGILN